MLKYLESFSPLYCNLCRYWINHQSYYKKPDLSIWSQIEILSSYVKLSYCKFWIYRIWCEYKIYNVTCSLIVNFVFTPNQLSLNSHNAKIMHWNKDPSLVNVNGKRIACSGSLIYSLYYWLHLLSAGVIFQFFLAQTSEPYNTFTPRRVLKYSIKVGRGKAWFFILIRQPWNNSW